MNHDWLDEDGYPTEEALQKIEKWDFMDITNMFKFIENIWAYKESGYLWQDPEIPESGYVYQIWNLSTAGWSGNEDIIRAMQANHVIWSFTAYSWKRGGHYQFRLQLRKNTEVL